MRQWCGLFVFGAIARGMTGAAAYLWFVVIAVFLIMVPYISLNKNKSLYAKLFAIPIGGSFVDRLPLSTLYNVCDWILTITSWFCMEKLFKGHMICLAIVIVLVIIYYYRHGTNLMKYLFPEPPSWHNLFPERVDDLNWLIAQLRNPRIYAIGLEGPWGSGKSYLVEGLAVWWQIHGKTKKYELITIDVLAVTLDDLAEYMVKELDDVLYRHRILSKYSRHLKDFFRGNTLSSFYALWLPKESSYAKIFAGFREELLALGEIIVINFEDIDRIKTGRNLRKVFYLADKLSNSKEIRGNGGCIKVIYQYDKHKMENLGFGVDYLEKYVQQRLCLTRLDFIQIMQAYNEQAKDAGHLEILSEDDMYCLPPYVLVGSDKRVDNIEVLCRQWFSGRITIRGVKHFLIDIQQSIEQDNYIKKLIKDEDDRKAIIAFYFIKRFMPEVYDLFDTNVSLMECFYIDTEGDKMPIDEIFAYSEWKTETFQCYCLPEDHSLNFEKYVAYLLLGLDRIKAGGRKSMMEEDDFHRKEMQDGWKAENLAYQSLERLVFHLLEAGQSPVNDYVRAANQFVQEVLRDSTEKNLHQRCKDYWEKNQKVDKGNQTILRISISSWAVLFRAFHFANDYWENEECERNYRGLLSIYFDVEKDSGFSVHRIQEVNYLWQGIPSDDILTILFQHLNGLQIVGNMNQIPDFFDFFRNSLKKICDLGFVQYSECQKLDGVVQKKDAQVCLKYLDTFSKKLTVISGYFRSHSEIDANGAVDKYTVIEQYLEKLREVIEAKTPVEKKKSDRVNRIVDMTAEAEDKLLNLSDEQEFIRAVNENKDKLFYVYLADVIRRRYKK